MVLNCGCILLCTWYLSVSLQHGRNHLLVYNLVECCLCQKHHSLNHKFQLKYTFPIPAAYFTAVNYKRVYISGSNHPLPTYQHTNFVVSCLSILTPGLIYIVYLKDSNNLSIKDNTPYPSVCCSQILLYKLTIRLSTNPMPSFI
jgi:hypothetical protein